MSFSSSVSDKENFLIEGVRITPGQLVFKDALETDLLKLKFSIQNVSCTPKFVRILRPRSLGFHLNAQPKGRLLSPGMKITKTVTYLNLRRWTILATSSIPICVNDTSIEYPVSIEQPLDQLLIEPAEIDFGMVDVGTTPVTRYCKITNTEPAPVKFAFDLGSNDLDLNVYPMKGELMGNSSLDIRLQMVVISPGVQYSQFWLRGPKNAVRVPVKLTANVPHLEIYHINRTWNFTLIDFAPIYFGTSCIETLALRNVSADISYFLVLGEVNNRTCILKEALSESPAFSVFRIMPDEGVLKASEGRICSVEFKPKYENTKMSSWKHTMDPSKEADFLVFVVIERVQSLSGQQLEKAIQNHIKCSRSPGIFHSYSEEMDKINKDKSFTSAETGSSTYCDLNSKIVVPTNRLCLHGIAMLPHVELVPTEFYLGDVILGSTEQRVLLLTNKNKILPIHFSYQKTLHVDIIPRKGKLDPLKSIEVTVTFTHSAIGHVRKMVKIELLSISEPFSEKPQLVKVGFEEFQFSCNTVAKPKVLVPKFNMGITPQITHEVGLCTDNVTFDSGFKIPQSAMLKANLSRKRTWFPHKKNETQVECSKAQMADQRKCSLRPKMSSQPILNKMRFQENIKAGSMKINSLQYEEMKDEEEKLSKNGTQDLNIALSPQTVKYSDSSVTHFEEFLKNENSSERKLDSASSSVAHTETLCPGNSHYKESMSLVPNLEADKLQPKEVTQSKDEGQSKSSSLGQTEKYIGSNQSLETPKVMSTDLVKDKETTGLVSSSEMNKMRTPNPLTKQEFSSPKASKEAHSDTLIKKNVKDDQKTVVSDLFNKSDYDGSTVHHSMPKVSKSYSSSSTILKTTSSDSTDEVQRPLPVEERRHSSILKLKKETSSYLDIMGPKKMLSFANSHQVNTGESTPVKTTTSKQSSYSMPVETDVNKSFLYNTKCTTESSQRTNDIQHHNSSQTTVEIESPSKTEYVLCSFTVPGENGIVSEEYKSSSNESTAIDLEKHISETKVAAVATERTGSRVSSNDMIIKQDKTLLKQSVSYKKGVSSSTTKIIIKRVSDFCPGPNVSDKKLEKPSSKGSINRVPVRKAARDVVGKSPEISRETSRTQTLSKVVSEGIPKTRLVKKLSGMQRTSYPGPNVSDKKLEKPSSKGSINRIPVRKAARDVVGKSPEISRETSRTQTLSKVVSEGIPKTRLVKKLSGMQRTSYPVLRSKVSAGKFSMGSPKVTGDSGKLSVPTDSYKNLKMIFKSDETQSRTNEVKSTIFRTHIPSKQQKRLPVLPDNTTDHLLRNVVGKEERSPDRRLQKSVLLSSTLDLMLAQKWTSSQADRNQEKSRSISVSSLTGRSKSYIKSYSFARKFFVKDYVEEAVEAAKQLLDEDQGKQQEEKIDKNLQVQIKKPLPINDSIAFPNDLQRSLRRWPATKVTRAIFTGTVRYTCPVNERYTRTESEIMLHQENAAKYIEMMRNIGAELKEIAVLKSGKATFVPDKDVSSCKVNLASILKVPKYRPFLTKKKLTREHKVEVEQPMHPLTSLQLYNIRVKPRAINFGKIPSSSNIFDSLMVENLNPFKVMFVILPGDSGIQFPEGNRKILDPLSKIRFKMAYHEESFGRHNASMHYVINENHCFEVTVYAEVIPKSLQLEPTTLDFKNLPYDSMYQPLYMTVGIVNNLQCYTRFVWELPPRACCSVTPIKGLVPPLSTLQVCIKNLKDVMMPMTCDVILQSESGSREKLRVSTHLKDGKYVGFLSKKLDLQELSLNLLTEHVTLAYNGSYCTYMFKVLNPDLMPGITVHPQAGVMKPRSVIAFHIYCKIQAVVKFELKLQIQIEKTHVIELPIVGSVGYPLVTLKPEQIKLRRMSVDSFDSIKLSIKNKGTTTVKITFQLHNHSEYFISKSLDIYAPKDSDKEKYYLEPGKIKVLYLHFVPHDIATYYLALPLIINDILGPVDLENMDTHLSTHYLSPKEEWFTACIVPQKIPARVPFIQIKCTVANHILSISNPRVYLSCPSDDISSTCEYDSVRITNVLQHDLEFSIDTRPLQQEDSFTIVSNDLGVLSGPELRLKFQPGQFDTFHVNFHPKHPGTFTMILPIYVKGYEGSYNNLYFEGVYREPQLELDAKEIYLQPIPLRRELVTSMNITASFYKTKTKIITNVDHGSLEDKSIIDTLKLIFMGGNIITPSDTPQVLPVKLVFRSDKPVSFRVSITFADTQNHTCSLNVVATADNSVLTTYTYLRLLKASSLSDEDSLSESELKEASPVVRKMSLETSNFSSNTPEQGRKTSFTQHSSIYTNDQSHQISPRRKLSHTSGLLEYSSMILMDESTTSFVSLDEECEEEDQEQICYPRFPSEDNESDLSLYLYKTLEAVECWLFDEGFHRSYQPTIPDGMSLIFTESPPSNKPSLVKQFVPKTVLYIIENLMGVQMRKLLTDGESVPEKPVERAVYVHNLYGHLLDLLKKQGACLVHVAPCMLLSYKDYVMYFTQETYMGLYIDKKIAACTYCELVLGKHPSHTLMGIKEFTSYSKQAWMDLILQLHKTMVLSKITANSNKLKKNQLVTATVNNEDLSQSTFPSGSISSNHSSVTPHVELNIMKELNRNIYSNEECILLSWLNSHFKKTQAEIWQSSILDNRSKIRQIPAPRNISNFHSDLSDGLAFVTVTASYCPYLISMCFTDLIGNPDSEEELLHNAIKVVKAWETIKLGFTILPEDIVYPNPVKMVLLCTYLYDIMPSYTPKRTLNFRGKLSGVVKQTLKLTNSSDKKVTYGILVLGDHLGLFRVKPDTVLTISRNSSESISITYSAKMMSQTKATLILCGNTTPSNFGRNLAFDLVAESSVLTVTERFLLNPPLYIPVNEVLEITPPYTNEGVYDIYLTEEEPTGKDNFKAMLWRDIQALQSFRRLYIEEFKVHKKQSENTVTLSLSVFCLTTQSQNYWIIFRNSEVGDFIIQLTITPKETTPQKKLKVPLPGTWNADDCNCLELDSDYFEFTEGCPLRMQMEIPARNNMLWNAFYHMIESSFDEQEGKFWCSYKDTSIGLRLCQYLSENNESTNYQELLGIYNKTVTYDVKCSKSNHISTPLKITIPDVRTTGTVSLPVHILMDKPEMNAKFTLTSEDGLEVRNYDVTFNKEILPEPESEPEPKPKPKK